MKEGRSSGGPAKPSVDGAATTGTRSGRARLMRRIGCLGDDDRDSACLTKQRLADALAVRDYHARMVKTVMRWLLATLMMAAGVLHLVRADFFMRAMPDYLPWHRELVLLSGACEFLLGLLLLVPRLSRLAAWGVLALLVAVFPANVHMALNPDLFPAIPPWALWLRVPLQLPLILWAWWLAGRDGPAVAIRDIPP